jgi:hypothetical protein
MSDSQHALIARRWFEEVWNQRREGADGGPGDTNLRSAAPSLPVRTSLLESFPDLRVTILEVLACGTDVVVRWDARGTQREARPPELEPRAATHHVHFHGITWLRFENGRLVEGWDSWNVGALTREPDN